jgi:PadR family transcriptional regulator PadR
VPYRRGMSVARLRMTAVIMDILDVLSGSQPGDPEWGLRLCEQTGYGTGTIYPALDRLVKAGWVRRYWEEAPPGDRPRRRFYELTSGGREEYLAAMRARDRRRASWPARPGTAR